MGTCGIFATSRVEREKKVTEQPDIVGVLRDWRKHVCKPDGTFILWGFVYDDVLNRFYDGQFIHTAKVLKIENGYAYTVNHAYRLDGESMGPEYTVCLSVSATK